MADFGQTDFGQTEFDLCLCVFVCVCVCLCVLCGVGVGTVSVASGLLGLHTTTREPKRAHLRVPAFKNTTKIPREESQRGKKRTNFVAGEEKKKREILGPPPFGPPPFAPPLFLGLGPHPSPPSHPAFSGFGPLACTKTKQFKKTIFKNPNN